MNRDASNPTSIGRLVRWAGRPLLTIPAGPSHVRQAAVRCYPAHTRKKRLVRTLLGWAVRAGCEGWLGDRAGLPIGTWDDQQMAEWTRQVSHRMGRSDLYPVLVWPADPDRGRVYVHLLDRQGRPAAFGKLAWDQSNGELLDNEAQTLHQLCPLPLRRIQVPAVLDAGTLGDQTYVVVQTVPENALAIDWDSPGELEDSLSEYSGPTARLTREQTAALDWWQRFQQWPDGPAEFRQAVERAVEAGVDVCRVHGDLNRTNVLRAGDAFWLLDWERSHRQGPCLTDRICMDVDRRWPQTQRDPKKSLAEFLAVHWTERSATYRRQVLLALAYLASVEFTPAIGLVREW